MLHSYNAPSILCGLRNLVVKVPAHLDRVPIRAEFLGLIFFGKRDAHVHARGRLQVRLEGARQRLARVPYPRPAVPIVDGAVEAREPARVGRDVQHNDGHRRGRERWDRRGKDWPWKRGIGCDRGGFGPAQRAGHSSVILAAIGAARFHTQPLLNAV